ncbi:MAG TPA: hypothetical protein VGQ76_09220 [Thermoanaerobaculia bacterium]|jgi:hypothetical protein|nr:hypothetical protein [Thermoanaerobaculia bacterium]
MKSAPLLVWAHVLLVWAVANYISRDPLHDEADLKDTAERFRSIGWWRVWVIVRAVAGAAVIAYIAPTSIAALMLIGAIALPFLRIAIPAKRCATLETITNVAFVAASFALVKNGVQLEHAWFAIPTTENRIAATCILGALFLVTVHGGTNIVRGILKKSGAVPTVGDSENRTVDVKEFNRGRLIGALERVLLWAVVIAGSYEAIGFIVAAKGLIRSRELETNRDMTEYFLIGSLTSVLVALATGSIAKVVLATYW